MYLYSEKSLAEHSYWSDDRSHQATDASLKEELKDTTIHNVPFEDLMNQAFPELASALDDRTTPRIGEGFESYANTFCDLASAASTDRNAVRDAFVKLLKFVIERRYSPVVVIDMENEGPKSLLKTTDEDVGERTSKKLSPPKSTKISADRRFVLKIPLPSLENLLTNKYIVLKPASSRGFARKRRTRPMSCGRIS